MNTAYVTQISTLGLILAGFSMAIAFSLLLHTDEKLKEPERNKFKIAGLYFLGSSLILIFEGFMGSILLSMYGKLTPDEIKSLPSRYSTFADLLMLVFAFGVIAMLKGIDISGYAQSQLIGRICRIASFLLFGLSFAFYIYFVFIK